jgi:23S rRNA (adenine2503-C2)-methyltransferase
MTDNQNFVEHVPQTAEFKRLASQQDASVNHIAPAADGGFWETRFVQRTDDYLIVYLSSHTGCNRSCRFCHLTATGQTMMTPATTNIYGAQAEMALSSYLDRLEAGHPQAQRIHFNFMARGEALANPHFLANPDEVYNLLGDMAESVELEPFFKVSTIMPSSLLEETDVQQSLDKVLHDPRAEAYYSLYSLNPAFRKRWLPKSMDPNLALDLLAEHQRKTGRLVVLHGALIAGQNDSLAEADAIIEAIHQRKMRVKYNLVAYNPHNSRHGVEANDATKNAYFQRMASAFGDTGSRPVPRVGFDVKASCGMFIEPGT